MDVENIPICFNAVADVTWIIINTFKPEYKSLDSSARKLVIKVAKSRSMTGRNTLTVVIFYDFYRMGIF